MEFTGSRLFLSLPIKVAARNGHSKHGSVMVELEDEDVRKVPPELRDELAIWIASEAELEIDAPTTDMSTIVRALQRAATAREEARIDQMLSRSDFDVDWWIDAPDENHPRVRARLEQIAKAFDHENAVDGALRAYAATIPYLMQAASEPTYPIAGPALDHLTGAIARFDPDAIVLAAASTEYKNAKIEVRRGATPYAFSVRDRVLAHLEKLTRPEHVKIVVDPVSRYRAARQVVHRGQPKLSLDQPVTMIPVHVTSVLKDDRCILFFADEDDRQRALKGNEDDIPL